MSEKKLSILQINKLYAPDIGGVERVAQQIAEGLAGQTQMQVLVCQKKGERKEEKVNSIPVTRSKTLGTKFSMPISFGFFRDLRRLCKNQDLLLLHMPFPLGDLAYLFSGYKGKTAVWWHADVVRQKKLMFFYRPIMNAFLRRVDRIFVATQGHIEGSAYLGPYREKCRVVPFGLNVEEYTRDTAKTSPLEEQGQEGTVKFLFVGRLVYYKGVDVLLSAFEKVPNAELFIVGGGPMREELEAEAERMGKAGAVHFLSGLSDAQLKACYRDCDVFVLPSVARSEAFGLVQLEAMAFGRPVVNTNLPSGVPYVSLHGKTGITVPPEDAQALADAMRTLAEDAALREAYGKAGYERVCTEFSEQHMMKLLMEQMRQLAGEEATERAE